MSNLKPYELNVYTKNIATIEIIRDLKKEIFKLPQTLNKSAIVPTEVEASSIIENMLLKFPMHPFYINYRADGIIEVLDGYKRLLALNNFIIEDKNWKKPFRLQNLKYFKELNGTYYCDLSVEHKRRINEYVFTFHYTMPGTSPKVIEDVLNRVDYKFWK